jgi:hypothetical protein
LDGSINRGVMSTSHTDLHGASMIFLETLLGDISYFFPSFISNKALGDRGIDCSRWDTLGRSKLRKIEPQLLPEYLSFLARGISQHLGPIWEYICLSAD